MDKVTVIKRKSNYTNCRDIWFKGKVTGSIVWSVDRYLVVRYLPGYIETLVRSPSLELILGFIDKNQKLFQPEQSDCTPNEPTL